MKLATISAATNTQRSCASRMPSFSCDCCGSLMRTVFEEPPLASASDGVEALASSARPARARPESGDQRLPCPSPPPVTRPARHEALCVGSERGGCAGTVALVRRPGRTISPPMSPILVAAVIRITGTSRSRAAREERCTQLKARALNVQLKL